MEGAEGRVIALSPKFDTPWYTGASITYDTPYYLPVSIASHPYMIEPKKYSRRTVPARREPYDNNREPGDHTLNTHGLWKRTQENFWYGSGQLFADYPSSNRERFWKSKGVDPWTWKRVQLLPRTVHTLTSANTNLYLAANSTNTYVTDGSTVRYTTNPHTGTWTAVSYSGGTPATAATGITTDGSNVYVSFGDGIWSGSGTTLTKLSTYVADHIGYVNGRLFATKGVNVVEVRSDGTVALVFAHSNSGFTFAGIAASPTGAYFYGNAGTNAEMYVSASVDATGAVSPPFFAGDLPGGETIASMLFYSGSMMLGTSRGLRLASIGSNFTSLGYLRGWLEYGPLFPYTPAQMMTLSVAALAGQGEYIWYSWANYDANSTGIGRANLQNFTSERVPAFATDLMAPANPGVDANVQGAVTGLAIFSAKPCFAVSGSGVWGQDTVKVPSGAINSGFVTYDTLEQKVLSSIELRTDKLTGTIDIDVYLEDEPTTGTDVVAGTDATALSYTTGLLDLGSRKAERAMVNLNLKTQYNMLSTNQASIETDTTGWNGSNATIARDTTQALAGAASLKLTSAAGGDMVAFTSTGLSGFAVLPLTTYTGIGSVKSAVSSRSCRLRFQWFDSGGALISTSTGTSTADSTSAWTSLPVLTAASPSGAAFALIAVDVLATGAANEIHYIDALGFYAGTQTAFALDTTGPVVRRWTLRALCVPVRVDEIMVPIILRNQVQNFMAEGEDIYFSPIDEFLFLKELESNGTVVRYQEGTNSYNVFIDGIALPEGDVYKWTEDRSFFETLLMVRLITISSAG